MPKLHDGQHMPCVVPCKLYNALQKTLQHVSDHVVSAVSKACLLKICSLMPDCPASVASTPLLINDMW